MTQKSTTAVLYAGREPKLRPVSEIDPLYKRRAPPRSDLADEDSSFGIPLDLASMARTWCPHCNSTTMHDNRVKYVKVRPSSEKSDRNRIQTLTCMDCRAVHG